MQIFARIKGEMRQVENEKKTTPILNSVISIPSHGGLHTGREAKKLCLIFKKMAKVAMIAFISHYHRKMIKAYGEVQ